MTTPNQPQEARDSLKFRALVGESIGVASMCWTELPRGVFDSTRAVELIGKIVAEYEALQSKLEKAEDKIYHLTRYLEQLEQENKRFRDALHGLNNECAAMLATHGDVIRNDYGRTNIECLEYRLEIARQALNGEG